MTRLNAYCYFEIIISFSVFVITGFVIFMFCTYIILNSVNFVLFFFSLVNINASITCHLAAVIAESPPM